jgi:hypothetical protein
MAYTLTAKQIMAIWNSGKKRGRRDEQRDGGSDDDHFRELEDTLVWLDECDLTAGMDSDAKAAWWQTFLDEYFED